MPARLAGRPASTIDAYQNALTNLAKFAGREVLSEELNDDLGAGCMAWLLERGRSPATANKVRAHLTAVWRLAKRRDLIGRSPQVERLREPKRQPKAWRAADLGKILASAAREQGEIAGVRAADWWMALFLVLYDTGLRISATMALEWAWLDGDMLDVCAEVQKQNADQSLDLSADALAALDAIRRPTRRHIFPWPWDRGGPQWATLNRRLRRILTRAGLPTTRRDLFHKLRRSNASYLKAAGGDPTSQLGHSTERVTRAYLDPRICRPRRQVDLLPRPKVPKAIRQSQLLLF